MDVLYLCDTMEMFYSSALMQGGDGTMKILSN